MEEKRRINPLAIELGKRLESLMKAKGISSAKLAKILNVSYDSVRKWVTGQRFPKEERIKQLTELFGVSADYLLFGRSGGIFPNFDEVMSLPPHKRFDKIVEIAKQETGCPLVVFDSELRERYARGEVSEQEVYENIKRHMEAVRDAIKKVDGDS